MGVFDVYTYVHRSVDIYAYKNRNVLKYFYLRQKLHGCLYTLYFYGTFLEVDGRYVMTIL